VEILSSVTGTVAAKFVEGMMSKESSSSTPQNSSQTNNQSNNQTITQNNNQTINVNCHCSSSPVKK
jgi:hypothetical protein